MANKFQIKRTTVSGRTPNTTNSGNTAYIDAGELAINLADGKLFSSNGTVSFEIGANLLNQSITNTLTVNAISANGGIGTSGQVLKSNGSSVYWGTDNAEVGSANQVLYRNSSNVLTSNSGLVYDGSALKLNGRFESLYQSGDEGGELYLNKPSTNTTIVDGITIDAYQNKLRIFEAGGNNRGVYIDITECANGVATNLLTGGGGTNVVAGSYLYFTGNTLNVNATSTSTASVVVARDANQNFAANVVTVNSIAAGNGQFSGPVSGVTTLGTGNTTVTGFINVSSTASLGNTTVNSLLTVGNTSVNTIVNSSTIIVSSITANGGVGSNGQVLTSNGTTIYWANSAGGGGGITATDDTSTNSIHYPVFVSVTGSSTNAKASSTKLQFNPSTGILSATELNSLSDAKFKTNVVVIENATDIIRLMNGVEFEWKQSGRKSAGLIAQWVEVVLPHLVDSDAHGNKTINYSGLIAYLIQSVKELDERVKKFESK